MRCFSPAGSSAPNSQRNDMMWCGKVLLAGWLAFTSFSEHACAARSPYRDNNNNPNLIPPPGALQPVYGEGKPERNLGERTFTLRHMYHHGSNKYPNLHRYIDIDPEAKLRVTTDYGATFEDAPTSLRANAVSTNIQRLARRSRKDIDQVLSYAAVHGENPNLPSSAWTIDEIAGPNVTDKETILSFARMAANAYVQDRNSGNWIPIGSGFNYTDDFGWEADGLRGHIFADETNATIVIGLKGTSPAVFDGIDTTGNDKLNDNLFGSCCCGQGGPYEWKQVCNCMTSTYTCNNTCLVKSLREKSHYYWAVRDLYHNVTERYPNSDVWVSGHSLGGVVSALLGLTYGLPTITFEAFPDALAASRLGLPTPPGYQIGAHNTRANTGIYHIGHTADPIYMGACNSPYSFCSIAGYAFQGLCHTGQTCIYDTVSDLGWRVGIGTHKIVNVIRDVLEKYDTVPSCTEDVDCLDCQLWKFFESNSSDPITTTASSSSSRTRTRTETCKTPGWWGCLDESTSTTTTTTTSSTSSTSTSTCKSPGWFGCKDPITTTTSSSFTSKPKSTPATTTSSSSSSSSSTATTTTCETPGWFGGCNDPTTKIAASPSSFPPTFTATPTSEAAPSATNLPATRQKCVGRNRYGTCISWEEVMFDPKNDLR